MDVLPGERSAKARGQGLSLPVNITEIKTYHCRITAPN
jgi:hypothetical protein